MIENKDKKRISVVVPVYNEEACLPGLYARTSAVMQGLTTYDWEIVFFDDGSQDASRSIITELCEKDAHCKAVFFARNFGYNQAIFYAVQQAKGDCAVLLHADLQNPPELIPAMLEQWEQGHDAVFGVKSKSKENKLMYFVRTLFYLVANLIFGLHLIPHATDFEAVDKSLIDGLQSNRQREPILRMLLQQAARNEALYFYTQDRRAAGKSYFSIKKYCALALSWIKATPGALPRCCAEAAIALLSAGVIAALYGALRAGIGLIALSALLFIGALLCGQMAKTRQKESVYLAPEEATRIRY